jgi:RND superfamily putative drug exporter
MESAVALRELTSMGRGAVVQTLRLTLELPPDVSAVDDSGWTATSRLARQLVADSAVARVRSLPGLLAPFGASLPRDVLLSTLPYDVRQTFVSRDGHMAMLEVVPREGLWPDQLTALVNRIRDMAPVSTTSVGTSMVRVGGVPALNMDYEDAVAGSRQFMRVVSLIVMATLVVLAIGFRSLLVPLKAIALNLLAVAASFGAVTLVFQEGFGASLLGVGGPLGRVFPAIPVLVFSVVFGLSMDYEVFLVARVREGRVAGLEEGEAIAEGLTHTARLITSAAAIMIAVFGAFMLGDFLLMKMLGFALAFAVLIDATVMRLAISPALLVIAGRWNWWPGERKAEERPPSPSPEAHTIPTKLAGRDGILIVSPAPNASLGLPRGPSPSRSSSARPASSSA